MLEIVLERWAWLCFFQEKTEKGMPKSHIVRLFRAGALAADGENLILTPFIKECNYEIRASYVSNKLIIKNILYN